MEIRENTFGHLQMEWTSPHSTVGISAHALALLLNVHLPKYLLLLVMITSVKQVFHLVNNICLTILTTLPSMLMIPFGMVKVVVNLVHASAHSAIHRGFVNNFLGQRVPIWKLGCVQVVHHILKTLR